MSSPQRAGSLGRSGQHRCELVGNLGGVIAESLSRTNRHFNVMSMSTRNKNILVTLSWCLALGLLLVAFIQA